jgi:hypothetical protein
MMRRFAGPAWDHPFTLPWIGNMFIGLADFLKQGIGGDDPVIFQLPFLCRRPGLFAF